MAYNEDGFNRLVIFHWSALHSKILSSDALTVDVDQVDVASVIAVTRYGHKVFLGEEAAKVVNKGSVLVHGSKEVIYGVHTGFGANSDMRTQASVAISQGLIRGLHYGVLTGDGSNQCLRVPSRSKLVSSIHLQALSLDHLESATRMPEAWVRSAMLIRGVSLSKGVSCVRPQIVTTLFKLLNEDVVPVVPLRGSISASGDLSPLSYLGGVMQGKPSLKTSVKSKETGKYSFVTADKALQDADITPIDVGPKEGLAITNGTAISAGVSALAVHEVIGLALLAQALTAMSVEATCGSRESFSPFLSNIRPHRGQKETAENILSFLEGSKLVSEFDDANDPLRQDRYSTRTAPQWIGPCLEDIELAYKQTSVEINSVTDNPVADQGGRFYHGGNFQAKSVTSAMEKVRQACQSIGQMLFAQCTELINPVTNRGLAPNLVVDEPNESWLWKGTDIYVAALQSELGFLCNPVGSHVQFAEMGNQAINSLALISARYTLVATDVLTQLAAAHLVALCQALDLRVLQNRFLLSFKSVFQSLLRRQDKSPLIPSNNEELENALWASFRQAYLRSPHIPSEARITQAIESLSSRLLQASIEASDDQTAPSASVVKWTVDCSKAGYELYIHTREEYLEQPDAIPMLGKVSRNLYTFVRSEIGVPFFGEEYIRPNEWKTRDTAQGPIFQTVGEMITSVYEAIRSGALPTVLLESLDGFPQAKAS